MRAIFEKIKNYLKENADNSTSIFWLRVISFSESSFFPIPPDPFQVVLTLAKPQKWFLFARNITIFSILGGVFGYAIGFWFFDTFGEPLVRIYGLENEMIKVSDFFHNTTFWSVFIAALTPIPYKIFTITAGLFKVNIFLFVIASFLGRGLRFFFVGFITRYFGQKYAEKIFKHFDIISLIIGLAILAYFLLKYF